MHIDINMLSWRKFIYVWWPLFYTGPRGLLSELDVDQSDGQDPYLRPCISHWATEPLSQLDIDQSNCLDPYPRPTLLKPQRLRFTQLIQRLRANTDLYKYWLAQPQKVRITQNLHTPQFSVLTWVSKWLCRYLAHRVQHTEIRLDKRTTNYSLESSRKTARYRTLATTVGEKLLLLHSISLTEDLLLHSDGTSC